MNSLTEWLEYQQRQHPRAIALGLERVGAVAQRLGLARPAPVVISVAGTNGKGSTVAFLEAILRAAGLRVGAYTSPHLLRYNERLRIDGADIDDGALVEAFDRIEAARGDTPLTYFEYGTLAALSICAARNLDVALLEVGLGGRLDAVNLVDADAAIVTTVDLDHLEWLGEDRAAIAREKAGIFRAGRPAIIAEADPPPALRAEAQRIGAREVARGSDFGFEIDAGSAGWHWWHRDGTRLALPDPALQAPSQRANVAAAIAALHALRDSLAVSPEAIARGVSDARAAGRLQRLADSPAVWVDVGHNPQAARELAAWLRALPGPGRTRAVFAALGDKDIAGIVAALRDQVAAWHLAPLDHATPRGLPTLDLRLRMALPDTAEVHEHEDVAAALAAAVAMAAPRDRVLVFGSFHTAAAALEWHGTAATATAS
jgi:dihydrofolate synthase/folylpolyglutamate synthase